MERKQGDIAATLPPRHAPLPRHLLALPRDIQLLSRYEWIVLSVSAAAVSANGIIAGLQFDHPTPWHWILICAAVLLTTAVSAASLVRGSVIRDAAARQKRQQLARSLVEDAFKTAIAQMSKCPDQTGGVVYLPDSADSDLLVPQFCYNKPGTVEDQLTFRSYVGCTGHAWAMHEQTCADLADVAADELQRTWKLSPNQIKLTSDLKTIISTPIVSSGDPNRFLGVVSIDCRAPNSECDLLSHEARTRAKEHAAMVALILELAELV